MEQGTIQYSWEALPLEERKRMVKIRMQNLGMYKGLVEVKSAKLRGDA